MPHKAIISKRPYKDKTKLYLYDALGTHLNLAYSQCKIYWTMSITIETWERNKQKKKYRMKCKNELTWSWNTGNRNWWSLSGPDLVSQQKCTSRVYQKNNYYINLPPSHVKSWSLRIQELGNRSFSEELLGIYYRNSCHIAEIWSCHTQDMSRICLKISSQSHHHGKCLERKSSKASMI